MTTNIDKMLLGEVADSKEHRAEQLARYAAGVIAVAFVVMIAMQTYLAFQLSAQVQTTKNVTEAIAEQAVRNHKISEQVQTVVQRNHNISEQVQRVVSQLKSCSTPNGRCYKEQQALTATQNGQINAITYLAVSCADRPGTQSDAEIRSCVASKLHSGG